MAFTKIEHLMEGAEVAFDFILLWFQAVYSIQNRYVYPAAVKGIFVPKDLCYVDLLFPFRQFFCHCEALMRVACFKKVVVDLFLYQCRMPGRFFGMGRSTWNSLLPVSSWNTNGFASGTFLTHCSDHYIKADKVR
jgi:hypothetical protein